MDTLEGAIFTDAHSVTCEVLTLVGLAGYIGHAVALHPAVCGSWVPSSTAVCLVGAALVIV